MEARLRRADFMKVAAIGGLDQSPGRMLLRTGSLHGRGQSTHDAVKAPAAFLHRRSPHWVPRL
jgi:hypothetical protein